MSEIFEGETEKNCMRAHIPSICSYRWKHNLKQFSLKFKKLKHHRKALLTDRKVARKSIYDGIFLSEN